MQTRSRNSVRLLLLSCLPLLTLGVGPCEKDPPSNFFFLYPDPDVLVEAGTRQLLQLKLPGALDPQGLVLRVNGENLELDNPRVSQNVLSGTFTAPAPGDHVLTAAFPDEPVPPAEASLPFESIALEASGECEVLNGEHCLLPYPSSRFLRRDFSTPTTYRLEFPEGLTPRIVVGDLLNFLSGERSPIDPAPYRASDGYSPTVQILMHFPAGVDLEASGAARLLEGPRNFDLRSLDEDSPSILIDAQSGERIPHFLENDANATGEFEGRQLTILRPAVSLLPGRRYVVAMRNLVDRDGAPVEAEPAFAALRDARPSTILGIEWRRTNMRGNFLALERAGVEREELVLAFDFVVASDETLTSAMLSMRDETFAWLATQDPADLFEVEEVEEVTPAAECGPDRIWRNVFGRFHSQLYLADADGAADHIEEKDRLGFLNLGAGGLPEPVGVVRAPFGIAIPCAALDRPLDPLVLGHGLFGNGPGTVAGLSSQLADSFGDLKARGLLSEAANLDYVTGGTNWSGLSSLEVPPLPNNIPADIAEIFEDPELLEALVRLLQSFIGQIFVDFDSFGALPDRLRQGQLNTLVLQRLLKTAAFNVHPAFQTPEGVGVIATENDLVYFGASLGGIMGTMNAALTPDTTRMNVDVPAINFSFILQRAKPFAPFQAFLDAVDPDPLLQVLGLQILHELWVRGEPAGYAHHVTGNTLPPLEGPLFSTNKKQILMTVALYDQQVSNLGAQIAAATLQIPNLEGSVLPGLPGLEDAAGPQRSAHVVYDTGSYVLGEDDPLIPPLANQRAPVEDNRCDPHGLRGFIPASLEQLTNFLSTAGKDGGRIVNFCAGACDAAEPLELPGGADAPCEPNPPPEP
ncbi:MAG: hypothetical protein MJE66_10900 [Proteobacteria bacterium]|nr:hypothetical protein [Pseudomonadota bacterium]